MKPIVIKNRRGAAIDPAHVRAVAAYPLDLLRAIVADLGRRNLRDYADNETRWCAGRLSAARAELRRRPA